MWCWFVLVSDRPVTQESDEGKAVGVEGGESVPEEFVQIMEGLTVSGWVTDKKASVGEDNVMGVAPAT